MIKRRPRLTQEEIKEIASYCGKHSSLKVAEMVGVDHTTVLYHWKKLGLKIPPPHKKVKKIKVPKIISYKQRLKEYKNEVFIRDAVGNLIRVEDKREFPRYPQPA